MPEESTSERITRNLAGSGLFVELSENSDQTERLIEIVQRVSKVEGIPLEIKAVSDQAHPDPELEMQRQGLKTCSFGAVPGTFIIAVVPELAAEMTDREIEGILYHEVQHLRQPIEHANRAILSDDLDQRLMEISTIDPNTLPFLSVDVTRELFKDELFYKQIEAAAVVITKAERDADAHVIRRGFGPDTADALERVFKTHLDLTNEALKEHDMPPIDSIDEYYDRVREATPIMGLVSGTAESISDRLARLRGEIDHPDIQPGSHVRQLVQKRMAAVVNVEDGFSRD